MFIDNLSCGGVLTSMEVTYRNDAAGALRSHFIAMSTAG